MKRKQSWKRHVTKGQSRQKAVWIRLLSYLAICIIVGNAVSYQLHWQSGTENKLYFRSSMQENGDGAYAADLLKDIQCFPVVPDGAGKVHWNYEDGYGGARTYGGNRKHEGVDIMASEDRAGCLQICSASDGIVEQMGWLELGGYRLGIRSPGGFYFYYAHLESYADGLQIGDKVRAGEVIGSMGNTGYGPEGTRGQFSVHLHFGIYVTGNGKEESLNPYPALRYMEKFRD